MYICTSFAFAGPFHILFWTFERAEILECKRSAIVETNSIIGGNPESGCMAYLWIWSTSLVPPSILTKTTSSSFPLKEVWKKCPKISKCWLVLSILKNRVYFLTRPKVLYIYPNKDRLNWLIFYLIPFILCYSCLIICTK